MSSNASFHWHLHYKCNYRCPYCFFYNDWAELSSFNKYLPMEVWVRGWHRIYEMYGSAHILLIGGEPFIYSSFIELVRRLSKEHTIQIVTNLSCTIETLIDFIHQVDITKLDMHLSFHPLFAKLGSFLEKALLIKKEGIPNRILYLTYPAQFKQIKYFKERFEQKGFYFVVVPFRGEYQGVIYPDGFTEEEKNIIYDLSKNLKQEQKIWVENQVILKKTKGKLCRAGQIFARIDPDGTVYRCGQKSKAVPIGNFFDEDFKLLDKPLPCEKENCPCEFRWLIEEDDSLNREKVEIKMTKKNDTKKSLQKVKYRRLGKTELMVSEVGLGGHPYDIKGAITRHSFEERMKIISKALDLGINYFDTVDGDELSSTIKVLKKLDAREKCIIAYGDNVEGFRITNADEKFIREHVESQLRTLQIDRIDILRVLDWSISDYARKMNVPVEKEIEDISIIISKLKKEGKVRFSCFTTHLQDKLEGLAGKADIGNLFDSMQIRFNFLENQPAKKIIPYAKAHDMGIIIMKPFRKGTLLNKYCGDSSDSTYADLKLPTDSLFNNLQNKEKGLAYALLKFILSNQDISVVIPGVASVEQVIENANVSIFD